jgi:AbrB family looped-hinge helix DNA binding protein
VKTQTLRVDAKGRVLLPRELREESDIAPGDTILLVSDEQHALHIFKPETFIEGRIAEALAEYRAGETQSLEDLAAEWGVSLDDK